MASTGIVLLASASEGHSEGSTGRRAWKLESLFRELNSDLSHRLRAGFQLRKRAREFGAILEDATDAGRMLLRIWAELHPLRTRVVLIPGPLRVQTELWTGASRGPSSLHQFAGPPLDRAGEQLEELVESPAFLRVDVDDRGRAERLRHLGTLLHLRLSGWTPRQLETYRTYRRLGSQRRTADALGVTQPTVSETLSRVDAASTAEAIGYFTVELDRALAESLEELKATGAGAGS